MGPLVSSLPSRKGNALRLGRHTKNKMSCSFLTGSRTLFLNKGGSYTGINHSHFPPIIGTSKPLFSQSTGSKKKDLVSQSFCEFELRNKMARRKVNVSAIFLSGVTGMTVAGVSLLAYVRFQHPEQFVETSTKMSRPELSDEFTRKWGVFGTGLADAIPQSVKQLFAVPDLADRIQQQKKKREEEMRQTLDDMKKSPSS